MPGLPATWNAIGLARQLNSQWTESESAFQQALEHTSTTDGNQKFRAEALFGIGVARLALGRAEEAERFLRQADDSAHQTFLNMMTLRAEIAMHLGRALLSQNKLDAALDALATANGYWQEYDSENRGAGEASYWLGQGHLAAKANREARAEFLRAIQMLHGSVLPSDARLVADARRTLVDMQN
jgi:tetratricopeptide (TPR) repeat protein